jgi:hypothetical protein
MARFAFNGRLFREIARSPGMRDLLKDRADGGAHVATAIAPTYTGPTWDPAVQRHGEYKASIYSAATLQPNGWRAEFGATAAITLQVEFGTGQGQPRPQYGDSPKHRVLGRSLDALRAGST